MMSTILRIMVISKEGGRKRMVLEKIHRDFN